MVNWMFFVLFYSLSLTIAMAEIAVCFLWYNIIHFLILNTEQASFMFSKFLKIYQKHQRQFDWRRILCHCQGQCEYFICFKYFYSTLLTNPLFVSEKSLCLSFLQSLELSVFWWTDRNSQIFMDFLIIFTTFKCPTRTDWHDSHSQDIQVSRMENTRRRGMLIASHSNSSRGLHPLPFVWIISIKNIYIFWQ